MKQDFDAGVLKNAVQHVLEQLRHERNAVPMQQRGIGNAAQRLHPPDNLHRDSPQPELLVLFGIAEQRADEPGGGQSAEKAVPFHDQYGKSFARGGHGRRNAAGPAAYDQHIHIFHDFDFPRRLHYEFHDLPPWVVFGVAGAGIVSASMDNILRDGRI